jgi:hypothetical protein
MSYVKQYYTFIYTDTPNGLLEPLDFSQGSVSVFKQVIDHINKLNNVRN